jgi:hypothetical protein
MTVIDVGPAKMDLLRIRAGDRNLFNVKLSDSGGPVNLTDSTIEAQARLTAIDPDIAVSAVIAVIDATGGQFEMRWPGEDVRTALAGAEKWEGVWDLQVYDTGEEPQTLVAGVFTIEADVTHA